MLTQVVQGARYLNNEVRFRKLFRKYQGFTMIPEKIYVGNLHLAKHVRKIPGAIVECGTWRGGMIAGIAELLGPRAYYLFDSFQGLPPAKEIDGAAAIAYQANTDGPMYHNNCTASEEEARNAMRLSDTKNYTITKGWFDETLPSNPPREPIALLRIDCDWYESTKSVLDNFGSRMAPGGFVIVDDYYTWDGCSKAVNEFAAAAGLRIRQSRHSGVCHIII